MNLWNFLVENIYIKNRNRREKNYIWEFRRLNWTYFEIFVSKNDSNKNVGNNFWLIIKNGNRLKIQCENVFALNQNLDKITFIINKKMLLLHYAFPLNFWNENGFSSIPENFLKFF